MKNKYTIPTDSSDTIELISIREVEVTMSISHTGNLVVKFNGDPSIIVGQDGKLWMPKISVSRYNLGIRR